MFVEARQGQVEGDHVHVLVIEAGIDAGGVLQRAQEEAACDQQDQRDRDLTDDECVTEPQARWAAVEAFCLERRQEIGARCLERRGKTREHRRPERNRRREYDDPPVRRDVECKRHWQLRKDRQQQGRQPPAEQQSENAASDKQDRRFSEELADETTAAGADRQSHGDLSPPPRRARQEHAGDVDARDQQDEADDAHQETDESGEHADLAGDEGCRGDGETLAAVLLGILSLEPCADRLCLCVGLGSWTHPV